MGISIKIEPWSAQKAPLKNIHFLEGSPETYKNLRFFNIFRARGGQDGPNGEGVQKGDFLDLNGKY